MCKRFLMVTKGCAINKGLGNFAAALFHALAKLTQLSSYSTEVTELSSPRHHHQWVRCLQKLQVRTTVLSLEVELLAIPSK